jgi:hypothetical protein
MNDLRVWAQMIAAGTIVVLPGYALLAPLRGRIGLDRVETLCAATGMSLALPPLLLYTATLLGLRFGPGPVWAVVGGALVVVIVTELRTRRPAAQPATADPTQLVYYGLGIIGLAVVVGRLWSIADLEYPLWTDSYAHTLITQLIVDAGAVPSSWLPYAPIPNFTYHFGFHTLAAWVHWLTGLPVPRSVVVAGQWANALAVPTTYLLAARLFQDRRAGLAAAAIAGLLAPTPLQFVNWGRYTQLNGQMVLPVAATLLLIALDGPRMRDGQEPGGPRVAWAASLTGGLAYAGLYLNHYRIFIFGVLLAVAYVVVAWWPRRGHAPALRVGTTLLNGAVAGLTALVITLPWNLHLWGGFGGDMAREATSGYDPARYGSYFDFVWHDLLAYGVPGWLLALAALAAVWGVATGRRAVWVVLIWVAAVLLGANLHHISLTPLYPTGIAILAFYLPAAMLAGDAIVRGFEVIRRSGGLRPVRGAVWLAGLALISVISVPGQLRIVARDTGFVWPADLPALAWVRREVPEDALFYIATSFWTPVVAHGLDAGYYLPLLAGRQTIMPPQNYLNDSPDQAELINRRIRDLTAAQDPAAQWGVMRRYGITHVYIGARPTQLDPQVYLSRSDLFSQLYAADGVYIFAVAEDEP